MQKQTMETEQLALALQKDFAVVPPEQPDREKLQDLLAEKIDELIRTDFNRLLLLLYRIDVDEKKLRGLLQSNPDNPSGNIIAGLVIERELEKIRMRQKKDNRKGAPPTDAERW